MAVEHLEYRGESPQDRFAYQRHLDSVARGKSLLQLTAMAPAMTPWIRASWSARSFTKVMTPVGEFDEVVCNISYHFNKHGAKFGSIFNMTRAAQTYFKENRKVATLRPGGIMELPYGLFEQDGRIISFYPRS
jgi:hypothetical protein